MVTNTSSTESSFIVVKFEDCISDKIFLVGGQPVRSFTAFACLQYRVLRQIVIHCLAYFCNVGAMFCSQQSITGRFVQPLSFLKLTDGGKDILLALG